jgi:hypothetical protein
MDVYTETSLRIDFERGLNITPILVDNGVEIESKTFSKKTHQIEELISFINDYEDSNIDLYL